MSAAQRFRHVDMFKMKVTLMVFGARLTGLSITEFTCICVFFTDPVESTELPRLNIISIPLCPQCTDLQLILLVLCHKVQIISQ